MMVLKMYHTTRYFTITSKRDNWGSAKNNTTQPMATFFLSRDSNTRHNCTNYQKKFCINMAQANQRLHVPRT